MATGILSSSAMSTSGPGTCCGAAALATTGVIIAGMGVAIARRTLLNDELERGTLIVPFGLAVPNHKRYVLLYAPGALNHPGVRAVHDWLVEEAGIFRSLHPLGEEQL